MFASLGPAFGTVGIAIAVSLLEGTTVGKVLRDPVAFTEGQQFAFSALLPLALLAFLVSLVGRQKRPLLGMEPQPGAEGRSLVPLILDAAGESLEGAAAARLEELKTRAVYSQLDRSWGRFGAESNPLVAIVDGPHRMVHQVSYPDAPQLYDAREDPEELEDVSQEQTETVARLREQVESFLALPKTLWQEVPEVELDEMRQNQLRALGYIIDGVRKTPRQLAAEQERAEAVQDGKEGP